MESVQNVKRRLRSVKNIGQITKAMELVAATKMRRSQELALNSRPYALAALKILAAISKLENILLPPILEKRQVKKTLFIVVSSDKGLAGSFNNSVFRETEKFFEEEKIDFKNPDNLFLAIGEKSRAFLERKSARLIKTFIRVGDYTSPKETKPIADFIIEGFINHSWDKATAISMHFLTALQQKVLRTQIFPVDFDNIKQAAAEIIPKAGKYSELKEESKEDFLLTPREYLIEPSPQLVLEHLSRHLVEMQFYHLILEANASEHAARRAAMKNASDNAEELSKSLQLTYNKSRQAAITAEITEITAGAESLK